MAETITETVLAALSQRCLRCNGYLFVRLKRLRGQINGIQTACFQCYRQDSKSP